MSDAGIPIQGSLDHPVRLDPWHQIVDLNMPGTFLVEVDSYNQFDFNYATEGVPNTALRFGWTTPYPGVEGGVVKEDPTNSPDADFIYIYMTDDFDGPFPIEDVFLGTYTASFKDISYQQPGYPTVGPDPILDDYHQDRVRSYVAIAFGAHPPQFLDYGETAFMAGFAGNPDVHFEFTGDLRQLYQYRPPEDMPSSYSDGSTIDYGYYTGSGAGPGFLVGFFGGMVYSGVLHGVAMNEPTYMVWRTGDFPEIAAIPENPGNTLIGLPYYSFAGEIVIAWEKDYRHRFRDWYIIKPDKLGDGRINLRPFTDFISNPLTGDPGVFTVKIYKGGGERRIGPKRTISFSGTPTITEKSVPYPDYRAPTYQTDGENIVITRTGFEA